MRTEAPEEESSSNQDRLRNERLNSGYDKTGYRSSISRLRNAGDGNRSLFNAERDADPGPASTPDAKDDIGKKPGGSALGRAGRGLRDEIGDTMGGGGGRSMIGKGINMADKFMPPQARMAAKLAGFKNFAWGGKKQKVRSGIVGTLVGLLIFMLPAFKLLELPTISKLLQKLHMSQGEEFGDGRSARQVFYTIGGEAERGRLGIVLTPLADRWEKRMIEKTNMRPLYHTKTGRHVGYEFMGNRDDFIKFVQYSPNLKTAYTDVIKNGGRLISGRQALNETIMRPTVRSGDIPPISRTSTVIDLTTEGRSFKFTRHFIDAMGSIVGPIGASKLGSRLEKGRGGVTRMFGMFDNRRKDRDAKGTEKTQQEIKDRDAQYEKELLAKIEALINKDVPSVDVKNSKTRELVEKIKTETARAKAEGKNSKEIKALKSTIIKGAGPVAVLGGLCAVQDLGDDAADAKYRSLAMPMMRLGAIYGLSAGDQVRAGDNVNMDEVGVATKRLHKDGTSWNQNDDLRREQGLPVLKGEGFATPAATQLGNAANGKKPFFNYLDTYMNAPQPVLANVFLSIIPGVDTISLSTGCGVMDSVAGFGPIEFASEQFLAVLNVGFGLAGTSTDELYGWAVDSINGAGIDFSEYGGAPFMGVVNKGAFLLGNDRFMTMGGERLRTAEAASQRAVLLDSIREEQSSKSLFARYFDPSDYNSLTAQLGHRAPSSIQQVASNVNPSQAFGSVVSTFTPKAAAAELPDYGVARYGYTQRDEADDMFDNPFENARIVEDEANGGKLLNDMNDKYGKCFGMKVHYDDAGVHLENGSAVNVFKLEDANEEEFKVCRDVLLLNEKNPERINYTRYRFYLADAQIALSLACYEGEPEDEVTIAACQELGIDLASESNDQAAETVLGDGTIRETVTVKTPGKFITLPKKYSCAGRTTRIDSRVAPALAYLLDKYDMCADDGLADGHKSHGAGLGVDMRPRDQSKQNSKEEWKNTVERAARDMGWTGDSADDPKGAQKGCAPDYSGYGECVRGAGKIPKWVRWIGYNGDVDHGDPWHVKEAGGGSFAHIHLGWDAPPGSNPVSDVIIPKPIPAIYTFPAPIADDIKDLL